MNQAETLPSAVRSTEVVECSTNLKALLPRIAKMAEQSKKNGMEHHISESVLV